MRYFEVTNVRELFLSLLIGLGLKDEFTILNLSGISIFKTERFNVLNIKNTSFLDKLSYQFYAKEKINVDPNDYFYVFHDITPCLSLRCNRIFVEHGYINYLMNDEIIKLSSFKARLYYKLKLNSLASGRSNKFNKVLFTLEHCWPKDLNEKAEFFDIISNWNLLSESDRNITRKIFNINVGDHVFSDGAILLITQPIEIYDAISVEMKMEMYKEILSQYDSSLIYIKAHPKETSDYSGLSDFILPNNIPMELLIADSKYYPKTVITLFSTAVFSLFGKSEIKWLGNYKNKFSDLNVDFNPPDLVKEKL